MTSSSPNQLIDYCTNIVASTIGTVACVVLTFKDLRKRRQATSKIQHDTSTASKKAKSRSVEAVFAPQLHYLSIALYISCISQNFFTIWAAIPYLCKYVAKNMSTLAFGVNKCVIILFQIERLQLCFGKNYYLLTLKIIVYCAIIGGIYYSFFQIDVTFDIDIFYGCVTIFNDTATLFYAFLVLCLDWTVLSIYLIKIQIIKYRWKKLQNRLPTLSNNKQVKLQIKLNLFEISIYDSCIAHVLTHTKKKHILDDSRW